MHWDEYMYHVVTCVYHYWKSISLILCDNVRVVLTVQEEENSRLSAAKRRLQRELDELTEQNETLQRDLATARKGYAHLG